MRNWIGYGRQDLRIYEGGKGPVAPTGVRQILELRKRTQLLPMSSLLPVLLYSETSHSVGPRLAQTLVKSSDI